WVESWAPTRLGNRQTLASSLRAAVVGERRQLAKPAAEASDREQLAHPRRVCPEGIGGGREERGVAPEGRFEAGIGIAEGRELQRPRPRSEEQLHQAVG